jgi:hypothetical protein
VVVALVGTVLATRWHHHDPTRPSVHGVSPANRAALQHVCRGWSAALLATQSPDGSFRGDPHRLASGWDTGQAITGLLAMSGGCNAVDPEPLLRGTRALWNQKRATGWSIDPTPAPTGEASAPATAWATLAFAASARLDGTADASAHALAARDALLGFQQPDGGFDSRTTNEPGTSESAYATVLSLWALVDAEPVAPSPTAVEARRRASAWLRRALTDSTESHPVLSVPGLLEESVWVLLRARRAVGDRAPGDDRLIQSLARAVTARCALNLVDGARVCTRPLYADGSAYLAPPRGDSGTIVTNWFPWAVAAAKALRDDDTLQLPPAVQDDLSAMLEWGTREMSGSADALAAEPGYKLSEYAVALGSLL